MWYNTGTYLGLALSVHVLVGIFLTNKMNKCSMRKTRALAWLDRIKLIVTGLGVLAFIVWHVNHVQTTTYTLPDSDKADTYRNQLEIFQPRNTAVGYLLG